MLQIVSEFLPVILSISLLWAVITALAQIFIEIGVDVFRQTFTQASFLLVWATLGGVIGNIWSMGFQKHRWKAYIVSLGIFAALTFSSIPLIGTIIALDKPFLLSVLAVSIGFVFGISVNLIEGYYYHVLEKHLFRSYGAAVYGFFASISIFMLMRIIHVVKDIHEYAGIFLCGLCLAVLFALSFQIKKTSLASKSKIV